MPKGFITVPARHPENPDDDDTTIDALIPKELVHGYWKTNPGKVYRLEAAKEVLEAPARIYQGVREFNEGGWCYVGRPHQYAMKPDIWVPVPEHLVFAVYLNPHYHVYEWRCEKTAKGDRFAPIDWQDRYGGVSWRRDS